MKGLVDISPLDFLSWNTIPDGYKDTFNDGVLWILQKIDGLTVVESDLYGDNTQWVRINHDTKRSD